MKAALRAVRLPRVFVDALAVAFRVIPTVMREKGRRSLNILSE